jgi:hypothetical protein
VSPFLPRAPVNNGRQRSTMKRLYSRARRPSGRGSAGSGDIDVIRGRSHGKRKSADWTSRTSLACSREQRARRSSKIDQRVVGTDAVVEDVHKTRDVTAIDNVESLSHHLRLLACATCLVLAFGRSPSPAARRILPCHPDGQLADLAQRTRSAHTSPLSGPLARDQLPTLPQNRVRRDQRHHYFTQAHSPRQWPFSTSRRSVGYRSAADAIRPGAPWGRGSRPADLENLQLVAIHQLIQPWPVSRCQSACYEA